MSKDAGSGSAPLEGIPSEPALHAAASWLSQGVPVVIPTETVYGLAAPARDARAVRSVFEIKGRPQDNPLIVHVTRDAHLDEVGARLSPVARALAREFWPGPLTLVVSGGTQLPWVTAGLDSVAVRHPAHAFAAALIDRAGPLAAPSANRSGRPSPTSARHAARDLDGRVPLVIDGGDLQHGLESTVLDVRGERPVLLRPGALPLERLEAACGCAIASATAHGPVRAPGMKYRHYSPRAELWLYPVGGTPPALRLARDADRLQRDGRRVAVLAHAEVDAERFVALPADPVSIARGLFRWLHELDELGVDAILVEGIAPAGVGRAVMDRLSRAATQVRLANDAAAPGDEALDSARGSLR
ncbi:MAG TPA: L-threonylcarbamoyladenylate synthase [Polyangiaceae bacterium]|nr:L-threonylcarbamoyladenylate synthase [Polyangiaceae bacterium]